MFAVAPTVDTLTTEDRMILGNLAQKYLNGVAQHDPVLRSIWNVFSSKRAESIRQHLTTFYTPLNI